MFDFSNYSSKSKYYDNSSKLVVGKTKNKTTGVAIKEFVGLKGKMYSYLVDGNSKHKKQKVWIEMLLHQWHSKQWMWWISSWLLEVIMKNSYHNNYSEKLFCFNFQSDQGSFFFKQIKFEQRKALKKRVKRRKKK